MKNSQFWGLMGSMWLIMGTCSAHDFFGTVGLVMLVLAFCQKN